MTPPRRPSSGGSSTSLGRLNERHWQAHQRDARLEARIQSFELAYRMQSEAADAFDVEQGAAVDPRALRPGHRRPGSCSSPGGCSSAASDSSRSGAAPASRGTTTRTSRPAHRALAGAMGPADRGLPRRT